VAVKKATFVKDVSEHFQGNAELYKVTPALEGFDFVVVSATVAFDTGSPETYIFGADENGTVVSWGELEGSFRGELDISKALSLAGYTVVRD
jgi:hypothetical protein